MKSLPNGWRQVTINQVADTALGKMLDRQHQRGIPAVPYLRNVNVQWGRIDTTDILTMELSDDERERFAVEPGDLLVCEGGEIGRAAIWHGSTEYIAFQKALHRIRSRGSLNLSFLQYLMQLYSWDGTLSRFATGSTIAHLPQLQLRSLPIPLPPLAEQARIVDILEDHLSRLDVAQSGIRVAQSRIELARIGFLKNLRQHLLEEHAPLARIGEFCETSLGKMLDAKKAAGTPTPYLRNVNVRWGRFDLTNIKLVPLTVDERSRLQLRSGDVLVCEGGEPGRCAVWHDDNSLMTYQKALHRVRVNTERALPSFAALMLEEAVRSGRAARLYTGTTIKHLPQERLRMLELPLPSISTQEEVLALAEQHSVACVRMSEEIQRAEVKNRALRHSLLAVAFSGRLTGRSSSLDRIEELTEAVRSE